MINHSRILLASFLMLSCGLNQKEGNCSIDIEFKEQFQNCIRIIEIPEGLPTTELISVSDVLQAAKCLEAITHYKNNMKFQNDVMYDMNRTEEELKLDVKNWMDWYEKNKCSYTMDSAEIAFKSVREKLPDYKSPSVIDSLGKLWMEYKGDSIRIKDSLFHVSTGVYWPTIKVKQ
jgi:hypothetical protein